MQVSYLAHVWLPYVLIPLKEPDVWLMLNRQYKPLGSADVFVDYDRVTHGRVYLKLTEDDKTRLSYKADRGPNDWIYLYRGTPPLGVTRGLVTKRDVDAYDARIGLLTSLISADARNVPGYVRAA